MNEYAFGDMSYSGGEPPQQQGQDDQGPKWFREYMAKAAEQNKQLSTQVEALLAEKRQSQVESVFEAKGFARSAAALYRGEPDKVDEWLSTHGDALAKVEPQQQGQRPPGEMAPPAPAASVVPPSMQADLQRMQQMGQTGAAAPQAGSDDELAAALRATNTPEEFAQTAQAHGWQYTLDNMGFV